MPRVPDKPKSQVAAKPCPLDLGAWQAAQDSSDKAKRLRGSLDTSGDWRVPEISSSYAGSTLNKMTEGLKVERALEKWARCLPNLLSHTRDRPPRLPSSLHPVPHPHSHSVLMTLVARTTPYSPVDFTRDGLQGWLPQWTSWQE